jgi:hypothetical protein
MTGSGRARKSSLLHMVFEFKDIWRVRLSADGPEKVTPLKVHLKPDAVPRRGKEDGMHPNT